MEGNNVNIEDVALVITDCQMGTLNIRDLDHAPNQLSEENKGAVLLVGAEGMSYGEAAAALNVPVGTVRSRLSRGRNDLRRLIDGEKQDLPLRNGAVSNGAKTEQSPVDAAVVIDIAPSRRSATAPAEAVQTRKMQMPAKTPEQAAPRATEPRREPQATQRREDAAVADMRAEFMHVKSELAAVKSELAAVKEQLATVKAPCRSAEAYPGTRS